MSWPTSALQKEAGWTLERNEVTGWTEIEADLSSTHCSLPFALSNTERISSPRLSYRRLIYVFWKESYKNKTPLNIYIHAQIHIVVLR